MKRSKVNSRRATAHTTARLAALLSVLLFAASTRAAGDSEDFTRHNLGIFLGGTDAPGYDTEFTWGVEYGFRFTPRMGVGVVYEETDKGHGGDGTEVWVGNVYVNPFSNWRLGIGAGREEIGGLHSHSETLYRFSAAYHIHVGKFALTPTVAVDRIDGDNTYVFGAAFSRPF